MLTSTWTGKVSGVMNGSYDSVVGLYFERERDTVTGSDTR